MTLRLEFNDFLEEANSRSTGNKVFASGRGHDWTLTAAVPAENLILTTRSSLDYETLADRVAKAGLNLRQGSWTESEDAGGGSSSGAFCIAAVAYRSSETKPGLWVEAFPNKPTTADVLNAIFQEFTDQGDIRSLSLEQFIRISEPNVVILEPHEIDAFLAKKQES